MANDSQDQKLGQPSDRFFRSDDTADGEQDVEGHARMYRGDENPIGQPADVKMQRSDGPDDGDDDVEGHAFRM